MKTPKSYRFSPRTIQALEQLKDQKPGWTETELIEAAIDNYLTTLSRLSPEDSYKNNC